MHAAKIKVLALAALGSLAMGQQYAELSRLT